MWKKWKHVNNILQSKPKQKKFPGLKNRFETHFNPDHTDLKMTKEIEYTEVHNRISKRKRQRL